MSDEIRIRNEINDYEQTIHAIVGFMNFFRFDTEKKEMRRDVIVFQGRRFNPSPGKSFSFGIKAFSTDIDAQDQ